MNQTNFPVFNKVFLEYISSFWLINLVSNLQFLHSTIHIIKLKLWSNTLTWKKSNSWLKSYRVKTRAKRKNSVYRFWWKPRSSETLIQFLRCRFLNLLIQDTGMLQILSFLIELLYKNHWKIVKTTFYKFYSSNRIIKLKFSWMKPTLY